MSGDGIYNCSGRRANVDAQHVFPRGMQSPRDPAGYRLPFPVGATLGDGHVDHLSQLHREVELELLEPLDNVVLSLNGCVVTSRCLSLPLAAGGKPVPKARRSARASCIGAPGAGLRKDNGPTRWARRALAKRWRASLPVAMGQKSKRTCIWAASTSRSCTSVRVYSPRRATWSLKRYCRPRP